MVFAAAVLVALMLGVDRCEVGAGSVEEIDGGSGSGYQPYIAENAGGGVRHDVDAPTAADLAEATRLMEEGRARISRCMGWLEVLARELEEEIKNDPDEDDGDQEMDEPWWRIGLADSVYDFDGDDNDDDDDYNDDEGDAEVIRLRKWKNRTFLRNYRKDRKEAEAELYFRDHPPPVRAYVARARLQYSRSIVISVNTWYVFIFSISPK